MVGLPAPGQFQRSFREGNILWPEEMVEDLGSAAADHAETGGGLVGQIVFDQRILLPGKEFPGMKGGPVFQLAAADGAVKTAGVIHQHIGAGAPGGGAPGLYRGHEHTVFSGREGVLQIFVELQHTSFLRTKRVLT